MHYLRNKYSAKIRAIALSAVAAFVLATMGLMCVACSEPVESRQVGFELDLDGYDASTDTPLSVHLEGNDASGTYIDLVVNVTSGEMLDLSVGEYTLTAIASPICADGTMWDVPVEGQAAQVVAGNDVQTVVFSGLGDVLAFEEITDAQIRASVKMATDCGMDADAADALAQVTRDKRDAALEQKKAEEAKASTEASTKAAEKAAKKAAKKKATKKKSS